MRAVCCVMEGERSDAEHFDAHVEGSIVLILLLSSSVQSNSGLCADEAGSFFGC